MAESKSSSDPLDENVPTPIDPDEAAEALKEVSEAMAILPRRRFGCLGRAAKYGAVLLLLLALFVYWNFLRTPRLKISKETSYITQPLTSDGSRVDYFAALEQELYPPEMKTDDNGYRLIVRAMGEGADGDALAAQVYEKLGLDPAIEPTMSYNETFDILKEYSESEGLDEEQADELQSRVYEPWTLDDLPMLESWLKENGPALDLLGQAVRKPTFCIPVRRLKEGGTIFDSYTLFEIQRTRSFARMLVARANYRIGSGDIDGAIYDLISCRRLGRHMRHQGTMVANLVGIALEGIANSVGVAASADAQPSADQLKHLVGELEALPPRPDLDLIILVERYYTLDSLQTMALGNGTLADCFSAWDMEGDMEEFKPGIAAYVSVDWNVVMRRVNVLFDDWDTVQYLPPPKLLSPGSLLISVRSRRVGDLLAGFCMPSFQAFGEADRRSICTGNLQRIALAMVLYQTEHGALPPAYTVDASGKPLHSWRVLLLPYLGEAELYGKLRLDEPWDSEYNRQFHDAALAIYQCPSAALEPGQTAYSVVVGQNTAFQAGRGKSLDLFGTNLILVVERQQPVCWMDAVSELTEATVLQGINRRGDVDGIGSLHPGGMNAGLRNGSARFISETIEADLLQGLVDGTTEESQY